jgi:ABC-type antimicrobial peptide transport system permease subunit
MISVDLVEKLGKWTYFIGILTLIGGILGVIGGLFAYGVGAIPGIIAIFMAIKLMKIRNLAMAYRYEGEKNQKHIEEIIDNLRIYFTIQGVLIIISFVMAIIGIIIALSTGQEFYFDMNRGWNY